MRDEGDLSQQGSSLLLGPDQVGQAAQLLQQGGVVAFPTETVYGLGADAANDSAVARVFRAKGRPEGHPLIVHLGVSENLSKWTTSSDDRMLGLAEAFWPGPLTMIVPRTNRVSSLATGGRDTVGLRVPDHPVAQELLRLVGGGVVGPSANRFGHVSPTTAGHVLADLRDKIDAVLDGGSTEIGLESTIVEILDSGPIVLLRPGGILSEQIETVVGEKVIDGRAGVSRAAGMLSSHYSPSAPLRVANSSQGAGPGTVFIVAGHGTKSANAMSRNFGSPGAITLRLPADTRGFARGLYDALRAADATDPLEIVVIPPTSGPMLAAILDRLAKASGPRRGSGNAGGSPLGTG